MPLVAMLAEATTPAAGGVGAQIDEITGLIPKAVSLATAVWDFAMSNPYTAIAVIAGLVTVGAGIIVTVRHSVN